MTEPKCNDDCDGWVHHQAPHKPPGVIMFSTPCKHCNADGVISDPMAEGFEVMNLGPGYFK